MMFTCMVLLPFHPYLIWYMIFHNSIQKTYCYERRLLRICVILLKTKWLSMCQHGNTVQWSINHWKSTSIVYYKTWNKPKLAILRLLRIERSICTILCLNRIHVLIWMIYVITLQDKSHSVWEESLIILHVFILKEM